MSLALIELFHSYKVLKRSIVSLDAHNYICTSQIGSLLLQALNNSKQLFIINLIVELCRSYYFREVAYRFPYIARVLLRQHFSNYSIRGVSLNLHRESRVVVCKQKSRSQELLKLQKCCSAVIGKLKDCILICKLVQQLDNAFVVFDKPPIKVAEFQE